MNTLYRIKQISRLSEKTYLKSDPFEGTNEALTNKNVYLVWPQKIKQESRIIHEYIIPDKTT